MIDGLRKARPELAYDRLRVFKFSKTSFAFSVHPSNRVRYADLKTVGRMLTGKLRNWTQIGGEDLPTHSPAKTTLLPFSLTIRPKAMFRLNPNPLISGA